MITSYIYYPNTAPSVVGATLSLIDSTSATSPKLVFSSTTDGRPVNRGGTTSENAITTIAICNTGTPTLSDETVNSATVNVYLVKSGASPTAANLIVSSLIVPAGETVFFSEERLVLSGGDELWVGTAVANPSTPGATSLVAVTVSTLPV